MEGKLREGAPRERARNQVWGWGGSWRRKVVGRLLGFPCGNKESQME